MTLISPNARWAPPSPARLDLDVDLSHVSVVIPANNEAATIAAVVSGIPATVGEVLIVDGISRDGTADIALSANPRVRIIERTGRGKGNALACGFQAASGNVVVAMDADGSASPTDISRLVEKLRTSHAEFVKGYRTQARRGEIVRSIGRGALTAQFNRQNNKQFRDICCGYIAFQREVLPAFRLQPSSHFGELPFGDGFEIDALLLGRAVIGGLAIAETEVRHSPRQGGKPKTRLLRDALRISQAITSDFRVK